MKTNLSFVSSMRCALLFILLCFLKPIGVASQCPPGQTNISVEMIGENNFSTEQAWLIWDSEASEIILCLETGEWEDGRVIYGCITNGNEIEVHTYDSWGDGWQPNNRIRVLGAEDGSFNCGHVNADTLYNGGSSSNSARNLECSVTTPCCNNFLEETFVIDDVPVPSLNAHPDLPALVALYNSTNGAEWLFDFGWVDGASGQNCDPCDGTWYGVSCDNDRVVRIDLQDNNLVGELPREIGQLTEVKQLILPNNELTGIPFQIRSMQELDELFLQNNLIQGEIPNTIGDLRKLLRVSFANNQLSGSIPNTIGFMTLLEELNLSNNDLSGSIPFELGGLSELTFLSLANNNLTGVIPNNFGDLSNLEFLLCSNNLLTGNLPEGLGEISTLQDISFLNNDLEGCFPSSYSNLCDINFVNFGLNPRLSWLGDFSQFCLTDGSTDSQLGVPCDDGDVESQGDFILADCSCRGCKVPTISCPVELEIQCNTLGFDSLISEWLSTLVAFDNADPEAIIENDLDLSEVRDLACHDSIEVNFRIESLCGANSCVSKVSVIDTLPPEVICPIPITISGDELDEIDNWLSTIVVIENCSAFAVVNNYQDSLLEVCLTSEESSIEFDVVFEVSDECDFVSFCQSTITCIPQCNMLSSGLSDILCNDNGTNDNDVDDYLSFTLDPKGSRLDSFYRVELFSGLVTPAIARYGGPTDFLMPVGSAGAGDMEITIINEADGSCQLQEIIFDPGPCSEMSDLNEVLEVTITIYPNPSSDYVTIHSDIDLAEIKLFDINGNKVDFIVLDSVLDLSHLANSIYFLEAFDHLGRRSIHRIVKI